MNWQKIVPITLIICVTLGVIFSYTIGDTIISGIAVGLAVSVLPLFIIGTIGAMMQSWSPERPTCLCGKCKAEGYEQLEGSEDAETEYFRCPTVLVNIDYFRTVLILRRELDTYFLWLG